MKLLDRDILKVIRTLPGCIKWALLNGAILGGGYIRAILANEEPSDIDLFIPGTWDREKTTAWNEQLFDSMPLGTERFITDNAITYYTPTWKIPVQVVLKYRYNSIEQVANAGFDFTVCCAGIKGTYLELASTDVFGGVSSAKVSPKWHGSCHETFYSDLSNKTIVWTGTTHGAIKTLKRAFKYATKGYTIDTNSLKLLLRRVVGDLEPNASWKGKLDLLDKQFEETSYFALSGYKVETVPREIIEDDHRGY